MKRIACFVFIFLFGTVLSQAHSGDTDKDGGHYDHRSGEYHYHHSFKAHQHPNGECPLDAFWNVKKRKYEICAAGAVLLSLGGAYSLRRRRLQR